MNNKLKINAVFVTVVTIACVILFNLIISAISSKMPMDIDLTRERVYEFSEQTKEVVSSLDQEVVVYALYPDDLSGEYVDYVKDYLARYQKLSDKFIVKYIDPYTDPTFVSKFTQNGDPVNVGSVIVTCGDSFKVLSFEELYESIDETSTISIDMEYQVTSAVMNVTGNVNNIRIYFTSGHGESESTNFMNILAKDGYVCDTVNINLSGIPEDASVIVITDPSNEFSLEEIKALDEFTDRGGDVMIAAQSGKDIPTNLAAYLDDWGVTIENDYVVENDPGHAFQTGYGSVPAPIIQPHSITENLIVQKIEFMAPMSRSIKLRDNNIYSAMHTPLLKTSDNSWAKVNLASDTLAREPEDNVGPLNIAVLSERLTENNINSRLFVIGSYSSIESPATIGESSYANSDFILNTIGYMTDNTSVMNIRAKKISPEALTMSKAQSDFVSVLLMYVVPFGILLAGMIVWWRRRYL